MSHDSGWRFQAEMQLARAYRAWLARRPLPLPPYPQPAFALHRFGNAQAATQHTPSAPSTPSAPIPKRVWAFWGGGEPPLVVARCLQSWQRALPDYDIQLIGPAQMAELVGRAPEALQGAGLAKLADWLRLELLHRFGGIWLDASTIVTASLNWVHHAQQAHAADFVGFYIGRYTQNPAFPIVENWFLAAPAGSAFIAALRSEYAQAVALGGEAYVAHLQQRPDWAELLQGIDMPAYLSQHLAMQVVLRSGQPFRLALLLAEDGPFYYHQLARWRRTGLKQKLLFSTVQPRPSREAYNPFAPLIKLRQPDRRKLDAYLSQGLYLPDSIADRFLR